MTSTLFELRISGHLGHEYVDQTRCVNLRTAVMRGRRSVKAPTTSRVLTFSDTLGTILISLPLTVMRILKKVRLSFSLDVAFTFRSYILDPFRLKTKTPTVGFTTSCIMIVMLSARKYVKAKTTNPHFYAGCD